MPDKSDKIPAVRTGLDPRADPAVTCAGRRLRDRNAPFAVAAVDCRRKLGGFPVNETNGDADKRIWRVTFVALQHDFRLYALFMSKHTLTVVQSTYFAGLRQ